MSYNATHAMHTRAVEGFALLAGLVQPKTDTNGNRIYYDPQEAPIENYIRFVCRDYNLDPETLTPEQEAQLQKLRTEMVSLLGGSERA